MAIRQSQCAGNLELNGLKLTIPCKFVCVATVVKCDKLVITVYRLISRYSAQKQQLNTSSYKLFTFIQNTFQPEIAPQVVTELLKDGNLSANWRRCSATKIPTFEFVVTKKSFADELHLFVETDPDWLEYVYVYTFFCIRISSPVESTAISGFKKISRNILKTPVCCIYHVNQAPELILCFLSVSFLILEVIQGCLAETYIKVNMNSEYIQAANP